MPATSGEVDACDVILFETLGICEPEVAAAIRDWPEDFAGECPVNFESLGTHFYYARATERETSDDENSREERWRRHLRKPVSLYLEGALRHLFPDSRDKSGSLRIQNWDRLYRLLALGPAEFLTEVSAVKELVADLSTLETALSTDDASGLPILRAIEEYRAQLNIPNAEAFVECLGRAASGRLLKQSNDWWKLAERYAEVIEQTVRIESRSSQQLLSRVVNVAPLSVSEPLVTRAACDLGEWRLDPSRKVSHEKRLVPELDSYQALLGQWMGRVAALAGTPEFLLEPRVCVILYRWGQLGANYEPVRSVVKHIVQHEGQLELFMRASMNTHFGTISYGNLDIVWDVDEIIEFIESDAKAKELYAEQLSLLKREDVRDYFKRRSVKPTIRWPPDEQREAKDID